MSVRLGDLMASSSWQALEELSALLRERKRSFLLGLDVTKKTFSRFQGVLM